MFGERRERAERLTTLDALDLHPAVRMHALVSAQVGELRVGLQQKAHTKCLSTAHHQKLLH